MVSFCRLELVCGNLRFSPVFANPLRLGEVIARGEKPVSINNHLTPYSNVPLQVLPAPLSLKGPQFFFVTNPRLVYLKPACFLLRGSGSSALQTQGFNSELLFI